MDVFFLLTGVAAEFLKPRNVTSSASKYYLNTRQLSSSLFLSLSFFFSLNTSFDMTTVNTILAAKYPAKAHALRVAESLKARHGGAGVIYLEAQKTRLIEDSDEDMPFR